MFSDSSDEKKKLNESVKAKVPNKMECHDICNKIKCHRN